MAPDYDASEFVDRDLKTARRVVVSGSPPPGNRAPTREEMETKVSETQLKLSELRRAQEELERERSQLEEMRRRQDEFQTGREEMLQHLTRGIGILEESGMNARRDAEQMAKAVADLKDFQVKVHLLSDAHWSKDNLNVELTTALTTIENARMEWNSVLLKFPVLSGESAATPGLRRNEPKIHPLLAADFKQLVKIGFAFSLPLAAVGALIGFALLLLLMLRH